MMATTMFLVIWIMAAVLWDLFVFWTWGPDASISRVAYYWAKEHPVIAFATGLVCGHVWWTL